MGKYIVKFHLLDGRGDSEQHFTDKDNANEFMAWCRRNTDLVKNAKVTKPEQLEP
jgi:hypothetical protein